MFRICHNSRLIRWALMLMYAGRLKSWMHHQLQSQVVIWHWPAHLIPPQPKIHPRISSLIDVILSMQLHMLTNIAPLFCQQMSACSKLFLLWKDWPSLWMQINCTEQLWVTLSFTHPFTLLKNYTLTLKWHWDLISEREFFWLRIKLDLSGFGLSDKPQHSISCGWWPFVLHLKSVFSNLTDSCPPSECEVQIACWSRLPPASCAR